MYCKLSKRIDSNRDIFLNGKDKYNGPIESVERVDLIRICSGSSRLYVADSNEMSASLWVCAITSRMQ